MPLDTAEVMKVLGTLSDEENLKVAVKESAKGGLLAGATTTLGGLLLGPPGLVVGGVTGGFLAYFLSQNKFRSVAEVLQSELTSTQQQQLANSVARIVSSVDMTDVARLTALVMGNSSVRALVLREVISFVKNEVQLEVLQ